MRYGWGGEDEPELFFSFLCVRSARVPVSLCVCLLSQPECGRISGGRCLQLSLLSLLLSILLLLLLLPPLLLLHVATTTSPADPAAAAATAAPCDYHYYFLLLTTRRRWHAQHDKAQRSTAKTQHMHCTA